MQCVISQCLATWKKYLKNKKIKIKKQRAAMLFINLTWTSQSLATQKKPNKHKNNKKTKKQRAAMLVDNSVHRNMDKNT